jgi:ABC-type transport system involved in multi-copper enzyme maturation permease subunit
VSDVGTIVRYALREALRRRIFLVVLVLTAGFLALYGAGAALAFHDAKRFAGGGPLVDATALTGGIVFGLATFAILFLATVLSVFLTLGVVRGDAEQGLLQPVVVRPIGRTTFLAGRFLAAMSVCAAYIVAVYAAAVVITWVAGDWLPDRVVSPCLGLVAGVAILTSLSLLGSVFLSSAANGIAVFMVFGAGLATGFLGQIGEAVRSHTLKTIAEVASWALPFEALYQAGLSAITADANGLTRALVDLGPFGGAVKGSAFLVLWTVAYLGGVAAITAYGFARRDL